MRTATRDEVDWAERAVTTLVERTLDPRWEVFRRPRRRSKRYAGWALVADGIQLATFARYRDAQAETRVWNFDGLAWRWRAHVAAVCTDCDGIAVVARGLHDAWHALREEQREN